MGTSEKRKILVVEDEDLMRDILIEELAELNCIIESSPNGTDAWDRIQKGKYDFVISDVRMPGMSGKDLLKKISKMSGARPKVLLVSGYLDVSEAEALEMTAVAMLPKPYDLQEVLGYVRKELTLQ